MPPILTFARFACGCIYRTISDQAVFCPQHRREPHRAYVTGNEMVIIPAQNIFPIQRLAANPYVSSQPAVLHNTERNSIHTVTSTLDGRSQEWDMPQTETVGICPACFIDMEDHNETRVAMCECGNEDCSYRWCGSIQGLHAYWRIHAQGRSRELTGIPEEDIFGYGPHSELPQKVQEVLDQQREDLTTQVNNLVQKVINARKEITTAKGRVRHHPAYLNPWFDNEYRAITGESKDGNTGKDIKWARQSLFEKVARLHIIGAMPI